MNLVWIFAIVLFGHFGGALGEYSVEDARCRCVCPNTYYFSDVVGNGTDNNRRYYTKSNIGPSHCKSSEIVAPLVEDVVSNSRLDAFLANCDCKYETRNTVLLKVVVWFVMIVLGVLTVYMLFLIFVEPKLTGRPTTIDQGMPASGAQLGRDKREGEENAIFGSGSVGSPTHQTSSSNAELTQANAEQTWPGAGGFIEGDPHSTTRWQRVVAEQRRKVFTDHSMLN